MATSSEKLKVGVCFIFGKVWFFWQKTSSEDFFWSKLYVNRKNNFKTTTGSFGVPLM